MLALHGQGRYDVVPAGDLGFLKLLGHARSGGDPAARAEEAEVRALFARFGEWRGLAGAHALSAPAGALRRPDDRRPVLRHRSGDLKHRWRGACPVVARRRGRRTTGEAGGRPATHNLRLRCRLRLVVGGDVAWVDVPHLSS